MAACFVLEGKSVGKLGDLYRFGVEQSFFVIQFFVRSEIGQKIE